MKRFKFKLTTSKGFTFPIIPIIVKNRDDATKMTGYLALVDSGAVFCVFHTAIAETLGIDLSIIKEQVVFKGVGKGAEFKGKAYVVKIMVSQKGQSHEFEAPVVFSDDINKDGNPLLGIGGFFNNFSQIIFDNSDKSIILEA